MNIAKSLRTASFIEIFWWLVLGLKVYHYQRRGNKNNLITADIFINIPKRSILKTQTIHQMSVDEWRRMQTTHRRMQTNVDESQTNVDESLDECRQMQVSVGESKIFSLIPEKVTHDAILLLLQFCNSGPQRYANFQFCSFICDYSSSQFSHSRHEQNPFVYFEFELS